MYATLADVRRRTGKMRFRAMARALDSLRIRYVLAPDGEPLVHQDDLDGKPRQAKTVGHRWDRIGSVRNLRP